MKPMWASNSKPRSRLPEAVICLLYLTLLLAACSEHSASQGQEQLNQTADATPPQLELLGGSSISVPFGGDFEDPGIRAFDSRDGYLSADVRTLGQVITTQTGTYSLTYRVADKAGNQAESVTRTVLVETPEHEPEPSLPAYLPDDTALLDLDFSLGPSSLSDSGFTVRGQQYLWSDKGFNGLGQSYLSNDNLRASHPGSEALEASGYLYLEVERKIVAIAENANTSVFYDSNGYAENPDTLLANEHYLVYSTGPTGQSPIHLYKSRNHRLTYISNNWDHVSEMIAPNTHVSKNYHPKFAEVLLSWNENRTLVYLDGNLFAEIEPDRNIQNTWHRLEIGARNGSQLLGDFFVRRLRMGTQFISPEPSSHKLAILGDSFAVSATSRNEPVSKDNTSVFELNTLQNATELNTNLRQTLRTSSRGASAWGHQIQASIFRESGEFLPIYNAACSGHGWVNFPDRDAAGEIPHTYIESALDYDPTIIVVLGSVNDLLPHIDVSSVNQHLKADLDYLIDHSSRLEQIYLFQTFGWHHPEFISLIENDDDGEAWIARYHLYNQTLSRLDGYRDVVRFVAHSWGASPPAEYLTGSAPNNITTSKGVDFHPSTAGHVAIADIIYSALKPQLQ